jgi:hypothetical protein
MRQGRIKIDPTAGEAVDHCVSRAVAGEWLFGSVAREIHRRHLWLVAESCGVVTPSLALRHAGSRNVERIEAGRKRPFGEFVARCRSLVNKLRPGPRGSGPSRDQFAWIRADSRLNRSGLVGTRGAAFTSEALRSDSTRGKPAPTAIRRTKLFIVDVEIDDHLSSADATR